MFHQLQTSWFVKNGNAIFKTFSRNLDQESVNSVSALCINFNVSKLIWILFFQILQVASQESNVIEHSAVQTAYYIRRKTENVYRFLCFWILVWVVGPSKNFELYVQ